MLGGDFLVARKVWGKYPVQDQIKTLINPAPVCANMIQTLVHTWRGWGCSIFIETNVKRQSNPLPLKVCSIQQFTAQIQPSTIILKYDSKKCLHFGTTAGVIRKKEKGRKDLNKIERVRRK